ncbi:uncharacterized protein LOC128183562 isoform X10 [Crassostrea angulata]|uniref:uncharacterized protein LOC128183562 isoform X10 n=1 Tax=Magallana angulata TaxID=2784310 RepID=UPI0022B0B222|nr:uncharacterized protein LOC128183562 isoform X10 [Crassostrea angulata]
MDERHWWIAGKIQETFKIGGYDNPTLLEDFMTEETTLNKINRFLKAGGPCRLFFSCAKADSGELSTRELNVTGTLAALKDADLDKVNILYFLRNRVDKDVDTVRYERDIFCGELKHNTIETLVTLLSDVYNPLIKAQKEWGECNMEGQTNLSHSMDKFLTALNESTASMHHSKQLMLKQPENIVLNDFKQHRAAALDAQLIGQYEELVTDWINTIETMLNDTSDERRVVFPEEPPTYRMSDPRFMDPNAGPLSELERWRRRQRLLTSITEQLKSKECKAVIGVLITAKSRLLKKWKNVDAQITDAMNDTKDKVKYLESLRRHFDQLYQDATPASIINNAIPGIVNSVRQMDSISRYYARTGFLGIVFTKITNQLVLACKEYIKNCTITAYDGDELWVRIKEEIRNRDSLPVVDPQQRLLRNQVEAKIKQQGALTRGKTKEGKDLGLQDDSLYGRLKACLTLQGYYRETLRSLRDSLGQTTNMSHFPSLSSVGGPGSFTTRSKPSNASRSGPSVSPKKGISSLMTNEAGHGVSIADEDAIMSHMDSFCNRIRQLIDVINTLAQFNKLATSTIGVPKPRKEDLVIDDEDSDEYKYRKFRENKASKLEYEDENGEDGMTITVTVASPERTGLRAIKEDEETQDDNISEIQEIEDKKERPPTQPDHNDEVFETVNNNKGLNENELSVLRRYFPEDEEEEGPSISAIISQHLQQMTQAMSDNVTTKTMLDVESKKRYHGMPGLDKDRFEDYYTNFAQIVSDLETFLAAYLHAIFIGKTKTQHALDIITRFTPVQNRSGIRACISEKFVEIFNWYESDLDEVHQIYEAHKNNPQLVRNAPPVAGAIHWSRQLLKRIEDPMKIFRDNKAVNQLGDFGRIVRIYNKLATALVTFESLWFTQWKNRIDHARNGLRATLFVHHPTTEEIVVNADERVLELIHEAKWLTRLGIQIPDAAIAIMQQESRFKSYKSHLELVLNEYKEVCEAIPEPLQKLFTAHKDHVEQQLQPGLSTLAWNSMNIDAFLHQIHSATQKLKTMEARVAEIMEKQVFSTLDDISNFYLFDIDEAFARTWPPEEFREVMLRSTQDRSRQLQEMVKTVADGLQKVANTLALRKEYDLTSAQGEIHSKLIHYKRRPTIREPLPRPSSTPALMTNMSEHHGKSKKMALMMDEEEVARERQKAAEEEHYVAELIAHYKDEVYDAVLTATYKSLAALAESSGCEGDVIRAISSMSNASNDYQGTPRSPRMQSAHSRVSSALSEKSRPQTSLSQLSNMTWTTERTNEVTYLQFDVEVGFNIPNITLQPSLDMAQMAIADVANAILESTRNIDWLSLYGPENFYGSISQDENVQEMTSQVAAIVQGGITSFFKELESTVNKHLFHFSYYNFLWKDDLHGNFKEFIMGDPGMFNIKKEVERFLYIEKKVLGIPKVLPVGCICLRTDPIKDALHGFAMAWKIQFASVLHEEAKKKLDSAVLYRSNVRNRLELHVQSLDQLNSALQLLEELRDMENKIDGIYLPIETMYEKLREFELRLPRNEVEEVDQLRDKWVELMDLADQVRENLLKERRGAFEQELDKNVKAFVVEVMEFRNAFDSQGPNTPNTPPAKAVASLQEFQQKYKLYDSKRNTLVSVSKLFGIVCKPFPELDKTGEELDLLSQLYGLFQKFIRFDTRFRDTLWADVDLDAAFVEVEGYWDECLALPSKLKDWDAYHDLKTSLQNYLEVFPLLRKLNSKGSVKYHIPEIRNRHWLDVMNVTGVKFQLEANVFKLSHLLDIGLIKHKSDIEEICLSASRELELEIKQRVTEDEWNEQMLTFEHYKNRGPMFLDKVSTERLLEQLEDAQALLASMLTSKYIAPLRDDTALWAKKLKDVTEVLELWLQVQDLWQYLEAVFSNSVTAKELQLEAKRFARTDKSWTKMMKTTYFEMRGVLQCCTGDEVPKVNLLRNMQQELEICFKSLMEYLDNKRRAFPRFYFVSDPVLLAMLSRPNDLESVRPHLKSIFSAIYDVKLEEADTGPDEPTDEIGFAQSRTGTQSRGNRSTSVMSPGLRSNTPPKIDKRLTEIYDDPKSKQKAEEEGPVDKHKIPKSQKQEKEALKKRLRSKISGLRGANCSQFSVNPSAMAHGPAYLPSEGIIKDVVIRDAVSVSSSDGEMIFLHEKVCLNEGVEVWLQRLRDSVAKTLRELGINIIQDCNNGVMMDEWAYKYPAQVCRIGMLYYWTRECDQGIGELKYDRKALQQNTLKKYQASTAKLTTVLTKGAWRTLEEPMLPLHKARLESMIAQSLYLRDILENMCNRKSLRETTDFEWRRCIRCYFHPVANDENVDTESVDIKTEASLSDLSIQDKYEPLIWILDTPYIYGNEFYGTNAGVALTPVTERCFLTMSQALNNYQGSCVSGPVGVGKTETVKGLATVLGHYIGTFQCSTESDTSAMGKIVQGTAMDGCWCCFDEVQSLNKQAMSTLLDQMTAVITALRSRHPYATLSDGQEISIKKTFAVHMTYNKETAPPGCSLPIDVRSLFRMVSLVKPDFSLILKAKCAAMGFRAPAVLGARLKALTELARDELPPECHHHFSVATLVGVLKRATQKRKFIRDEKTVDRLEAKDRETSRSDSQASEAPSKIANPQQSVTVQQYFASFNVASSGIKMTTGAGMSRKTGTPNPLTMAGKLEHALVAQTIKEIIGPRFTDQNMKIFKHILNDIFAGLPDPPTVHQIPSARSRGFDVELVLKQKSVDKGLVAHDPWIERCKQLYNISKVHHGVIVAGPPGSGKSSCIQTLVDALSLSNQAGTSRQSQGSRTTGNIQENQHKLIKINPMVVDDCSLMFGYLNVNNDWVDGIFTSACRKANRNQSTTWLCLDGPLNPGWADNFNPILNGDKVLHLKNGDKMFLSDNIIVIFETDNLSNASPASVSRSGIVYIDKDVLGWKPIADAWLESRSPQEIHNVPHHKFTRYQRKPETDTYEPEPIKTVEGVLQRAFAKTLDPISQFVLNEARPRLSLSLVGMFKTCLGLLSSMLANNNEIGGELHIERLYLFCLIWTFGGLLDSADRKSFSDILKNLSNALPDDDRDICVFDYYVDESGEWDPWTSKLPEAVYADNQDMLGEVFVPSVDTIRTRNLMEFASFSGLNVLLVGANGSGKTKLIEEFIDYMERLDPQAAVWKRLVFSGASTAKQLQSFLESNIYHRQGFVYGAKDKKKLKVFIDDVNLPVPDDYDVQRCNELLRQLLDDKILCKLQKPFEMKTVEGLSIISAMSMSEQASVSSRQLSDRLLRHFAVFNLPTPQDDAMKSIVHGILDVNMTDGDRPGLDIDLHNGLVKASCELLKALQNVLRPSPMHGRRHYLFTLKDITTCFQCVKKLPEESRADETLIPVISLWRHEMHRIIRDRLSRTSDLIWFDTTIQEIIEQTWPNLKESFLEYFVTFPMDARLYQRPVTSVGTKHIKVTLQPIENLRDVHSCLNTHLTRYNEEFGNVRLDVMLSDFIISHVIRMHRVLSFHHGGNMLLIGAVGSHLSTLCKLALHVADVPIHKMDTSKRSNFFDGLRSAVRLCGSEGKILALLFTARDLEDPVYLDAINSLLISGEYPHLFTNDEMEGLLQAIGPAMKREFPSLSVDPMKFFVARVKSNLHIVMCLQPMNSLLKLSASQYPGMLSGCAINWMCDWPQEALLGEASYFITRYQLTEEFENLSEKVTSCLANIHSFVLRDCAQLPWAGDLSEEININQVKVEKKKDQQIVKFLPAKVPNLPYSKVLLQERIKLQHRSDNMKAKNETYVGPTTFRRFMETFKYLYNLKSQERTETVDQLKRVLHTLDQTRHDAKIMKKAIKTITSKFEDAKKTTSNLMKQLTTKATALEKLKSRVTQGTDLEAHMKLYMTESEDEEEEELLLQEEYDDYDKEFDKMREAKLKNRQAVAKDEYVQAQKTVEECRQNLEYARQQVIIWKGKVDRACIERLRGFGNPPTLVGQVMEMVMILIGKRLPSQRLYETRELTGKEEMSSRMSSSSSSTRIGVKKDRKKSARSSAGTAPQGKKDGSDKFDRAQWKAMQQTMSDTPKFVDMLHNVSWEDGLSDDVLRAVESYLAVSREGQLGVTGEGTLLDHAQETTFAAKKRTPSPDGTKGITIASAKYSSEDCATLVQYTIAIVEYTRLCGPLKGSLEKLHELEREIEENERLQKESQEEVREERSPTPEPEPDYVESDLPGLQDTVNSLQKQFDQSVVEKHSLEMELQSMNERLKAATEMVDSLKPQEASWRKHVKENDCNEMLVANCVTASAFLAYCGPASIDVRKRMGEFFMQVCEFHGLPMPRNKLFRNMELITFLYKPMDVIRMETMHLSITKLMLENACFLMQRDSMVAWPLICDPTSRVLDWLRNFYGNTGLVEVKYSEIRSQFENCLAEGCPLLVTDCDTKQLAKDKRFRDAIQSCKQFINGKLKFKITVEDHEVECDPRFRLFLHTTVEPHIVPRHLAAYTSVIYFQRSRADIEETLLDRFIFQEKSKLEEERVSLLQERKENLELMEKLEKSMLESLSSDIRLMNELPATKKLAELKKQYDETLDSQERVESNEATNTRNRELSREFARRGAVCFHVMQYLREVNPLYQVSYHQFQQLYDSAIAHSERAQRAEETLEKITHMAYTTFARGLLERDRFIFTLLLAIEVEDSLGNIGPGEREFLVSPNYSAVVMTKLGFTQPPDSKIVQMKKPFDWMHDDQFHNLQVLATHFEWFQEKFERMPKDGREMEWRMLCDNVEKEPENMPLPDKMDSKDFAPMKRLLVVRAVRSDRLMQASTVFIHRVLGKNWSNVNLKKDYSGILQGPEQDYTGYYGDMGLDLSVMYKQSAPVPPSTLSLPILLLYSFEAEAAQSRFLDFSGRRQAPRLMVTITDNSQATRSKVRKTIRKAIAEGSWVYLHNAHNAPNVLNSLESFLVEKPNPEGFRLWVACQADPEVIPVRLLQNSIKAVVDTPKVMKDSMIRSFSWFEPDILKQSSRPEWPVMLHNLCFLHAAIQLRARFGQGGWNCPQDFFNIGYSCLQEALAIVQNEFKEPLTSVAPDGSQNSRSVSYNGIRYMVAEIVYGSHVTDFYDQQSLCAMVDFWLSSGALKRDFEVKGLKYRHPQAFFNPNVRLNTLIQALDGAPNHNLDVPEGCHIHQTIVDELSATLLGDDQYVFTRLNKVFDSMPSTLTLSHKMFPRPPTPFDGPAQAGISKTSNNPSVVHQGVFSTASYATHKIRFKDVELWQICNDLLQKTPKIGNSSKSFREFVVEKIRKLPGDYPIFNDFIMKECEILHQLLTEVRNTLTTIRNACENNVMGDQLSDHYLSAADDLYHLRIPRIWCKMTGTTAPPYTYNAAQWLRDLEDRWKHFDKILSMGRKAMPAYWLGAFFNPRGLLALLKQEAIKNYCGDRSGNFEQFTFQTDTTFRDFGHLLQPPPEGVYIHGIHLWGCSIEKTTNEFQDQASRQGYAPLPVLHLQCYPVNEKPALQEPSFQCPLYASRIAPRDPIMEIDIKKEGIPPMRWALRGLTATIWPY